MQYKKKPVVIEAIVLNNNETSIKEALEFMGQVVNLTSSMSEIKFSEYCDNISDNGGIGIKTLEGEMKCNFGDFIIKGIKGEFYPCKPDIFEATYEAVQ